MTHYLAHLAGVETELYSDLIFCNPVSFCFWITVLIKCAKKFPNFFRETAVVDVTWPAELALDSSGPGGKAMREEK
ncbi:hypothetical protein CHELA20_11215 [Hyphomicrobiales bacterium]|nr:hypothetical protein CHELA20_11215 [Hyphomicrobiales bacterium]